MSLLIKICVVLLLGAGIYWFFTQDKKECRSPQARLERFLANEMDHILAPLNQEMPTSAFQELRSLKDNFDYMVKNSSDQKGSVMASSQLCKTMLSALDVRQHALQRLAAAEGGKYTNLEQGFRKELKIREQATAFADGVRRSWDNDALRFRKKIQSDIIHLRTQQTIEQQNLKASSTEP